MLRSLHLVFQRRTAVALALDVTLHFRFKGAEDVDATVVIRDGELTVEDGHVGEPSLRVRADAATWLGFVRKEKSLVWALLRRKIRLTGSPKHLVAFGKCFP